VELFDVVSVSAGTRGVQVVLSPADYLRAAKATVSDLTKDLRVAGAGFAETGV
jgi:Cys-tRNA(Pro)/Cys-tRNA(Cys) deacylase